MIAPTRNSAGIGEALPPLTRRFTQADMVSYGAATWDWHRLHYDPDYARAKGLPGTLVDGQVFGALFARVVTDWAGPRAFITRLSFRMKAMAFAGDTLVAAGEVTAVRETPDALFVTFAQRLMNGERLAADAVTEVRLPRA